MVLGKKGFTLAEVLIALGIVGVIAATVLPGLVDNSKKSKNAAVLGRVVVAVEAGAQNYIQAKNDESTDGSYVQDLLGIGSDYKDDDLAKYIGFNFIEKVGANHSVIRFATSWATKPENVDRLIAEL